MRACPKSGELFPSERLRYSLNIKLGHHTQRVLGAGFGVVTVSSRDYLPKSAFCQAKSMGSKTASSSLFVAIPMLSLVLAFFLIIIFIYFTWGPFVFCCALWQSGQSLAVIAPDF